MDAMDDFVCEIAMPERHEWPCLHPASVVYLDLVQSERIGKAKTVNVCRRHAEILNWCRKDELTLIGQLQELS
jgi:hypothetical protein